MMREKPAARALSLLLLVAAAFSRPLRGDEHSGFLADLSAVAEGNTHHGYDSGKEAAELWSLGAPSAAATALFPPGRSLQQLQGEARRVRAQSADAKSAKDKTEQEGSAISLALNRKLAVLPESSECSCAHKNAWAVVTAARAQVLKEEGGEAAGGDVKAQADECPCRSALVSAVTQVLQEKLETLTEELGSSTSAALALQRALVSMRLPDALAGELTKELDQSLAKKAKKKTGVEKHAKEAKSEPADNAAPEAKPEVKQAEEPEAINVIVNNNMGDNSYNVTTSEVVNQSLPYFYGYKYPQAFVRGGQAPFKPPATYPWRSGKEEGGMNLIVNVNNYIMPKGGCYSTRCFQMRAHKAQLRALKTKKAVHQLKRSASAASVASRVSAQQQRTQERVLQDRLNSAVNMLQKIGHESGAAKLGAAPKKQKTERSQDALEQERQRLVDTARTLENVARRRAAAIREHGALADSAKARAVSTQGKMTQLFQLISGVNTRTARGSKGVSEADVLSHVDEWEEAQRDEMHNEEGFQLLSPKHGDMAAAAGRGYDGARENEFVGGRFNALTGGASKKVPDLEHFDIQSMLGHRGGMEEESDKDARNDLMGYYHSLQLHVKKKHLKHAGPNRRIGDHEARDDLSNFYDDEAAQEGLDVDEETGLKKGQTDPLYDLAANGKMQVKHALHRESARQARSDLSGFYKNLGRGFPKISPDRQRFKSTVEARQDLFGKYFASLTKEGRHEHTHGRKPQGRARHGDAVHGWQSTRASRGDLISGYFGRLSKEGRRGHIKSQAPASSHMLRAKQADKDIADFYNKLDANTREYSHQEHQKREVNVEGLSSTSASNDLNFFYDHISKGDEDALKLHKQAEGFVLPAV